jgi:hypothetical protein
MKKPLIMSLSVVAILVLPFAWCTGRNACLDSKAPQVKAGMSAKEVTDILGHPDKDSRCAMAGPGQGCVREFQYLRDLGGFPAGRCLIVAFSADDKVFYTAELVSP